MSSPSDMQRPPADDDQRVLGLLRQKLEQCLLEPVEVRLVCNFVRYELPRVPSGHSMLSLDLSRDVALGRRPIAPLAGMLLRLGRDQSRDHVVDVLVSRYVFSRRSWQVGAWLLA